MGCWHETCGFSNLPITNGMECRMMFIRAITHNPQYDNRGYNAFDWFEPVSVLVKGTYNDYGWMDFEEGEEQNLFQSAKDLNLIVAKEEDDNPEFPPNVYQWMIREDTYQMMLNIPLDHWSDNHPKTVKETIDRLEHKMMQYIHEVEVLEDGRERFSLDRDLDDTLEHYCKYSAIKRLLLHSPDTLSLYNAKKLLEIIRLSIAMEALRKPLSPTIGCGSQDYNMEGYNLFADFIKNAIAHAKEYDE